MTRVMFLGLHWDLFSTWIIIVLILFAETAWLLPALDVRAEQVIAGTAEPFSNLHLFYIGFDAIKLILLFLLGTLMFKRNLRSE